MWLVRETRSFPGIVREDAPEAVSAPIGKKRVPLASLHRDSNVHALAPLTVSKARPVAGAALDRHVRTSIARARGAEAGWNHEEYVNLFVPWGTKRFFYC
jgi:hypothetical protein